MAGPLLRRICGPAGRCRRLPGTPQSRGGGACAHRKVAMTPSTPVRHAVPATASAAVLALAFGFLPTGPALAVTADLSPAPASDTQAPADCGLVCLPILASSPDAGQNGRPRKSREPAAPPAQPAPPAEPPAPTAQPVQPPPAQAGTQPPVPPAVPVTDEAPAEPVPETASAAAGYRPPTGPSSGKDWNSPVTRSPAPTRAAAVRTHGGDTGGPAAGSLALGTLLVGASAGAFAVWNRNRNRLRSH